MLCTKNSSHTDRVTYIVKSITKSWGKSEIRTPDIRTKFMAPLLIRGYLKIERGGRFCKSGFFYQLELGAIEALLGWVAFLWAVLLLIVL